MTDLAVTGTIVPTGPTRTPWQHHVLAWLAGYGPATREAYARDLRGWTRWLQTHQVTDPLEASRAMVTLHLRDLEGIGRTPSTVARRRAALASFYAYLVVEEVLTKSPVTHVKGPHVDSSSPRTGLTADQLRLVLRAAEKDGPIAHALLCLLALNGLRVSEVCGIRRGDLEEERGHQVVTVHRKGGKVARPALAPRTAAAVTAVLERVTVTSTELATPTTAADRYLLDLDRFTAGRIVRRIGVTASVPTLCPHDLRHTFATLLLENGVPLHEVQDAMSHASPVTTQRYNRRRNQLENAPTYRLAASLGI